MRRELKFRTFEEVRAELTRLEQGPVETTGQWSFFQIIVHLAKGIEGSMKGVRREMSFWRRHILGPLLYRLFAFRGYIPKGIKGPPADRIEGNETEAIAQFRKALEAFEKSEGPYSDHPILGQLTKKQWVVFHSMHFANHVGYIKLKDK